MFLAPWLDRGLRRAGMKVHSFESSGFAGIASRYPYKFTRKFCYVKPLCDKTQTHRVGNLSELASVRLGNGTGPVRLSKLSRSAVAGYACRWR